MGSYILKAIEVEASDGKWNAVKVPERSCQQGTRDVYDSNFEEIYNQNSSPSLFEVATPILCDRLSETVRDSFPRGTYCLRLDLLKLFVEKQIEKTYSNTVSLIHKEVTNLILKAATNHDGQDVEPSLDLRYSEFRSAFLDDQEQLRQLIALASEIETIGMIIGGCDEPDRVKMVFSIMD